MFLTADPKLLTNTFPGWVKVRLSRSLNTPRLGLFRPWARPGAIVYPGSFPSAPLVWTAGCPGVRHGSEVARPSRPEGPNPGESTRAAIGPWCLAAAQVVTC